MNIKEFERVEWIDEKEEMQEKIKQCVDYAFDKVTQNNRDERTLTYFAMKQSNGHVNPVMVLHEIQERLLRV